VGFLGLGAVALRIFLRRGNPNPPLPQGSYPGVLAKPAKDRTSFQAKSFRVDCMFLAGLFLLWLFAGG
jgi:hypothetical protein